MANEKDVVKDICPVIAINILDFNYIKDSKSFHNCYRLKNITTGKEMPGAETFEIHFAELPKAVKEKGFNMVIEQKPEIFGVAFI